MSNLFLPDFEFVFVEGGEFMMGSNASDRQDELPEHLVRLSNFYIGKFPVTQRLWQAVMNSNPSHFKGERRPVENVSWQDIQIFIDILNTLDEARVFRALHNCLGKFRVPTEAEWEFTAREGKYHCNTGIDVEINAVWFDEDHSKQETHAVDLGIPNKLGIYDLFDNVWEWCNDWWSENYYTECLKQGMVTDPTGPLDGWEKIIRGGPGSLCFHRDLAQIAYKAKDTGFRLVLPCTA